MSTSSQTPCHTRKCCAMGNTLIGKNFISLLLQRHLGTKALTQVMEILLIT
uniref:Cytochrome P450 family 7 subfamily A member 1 n=1 Tax=Myotis myotis TaxID=51298 RepID=A0A7J7TIX9_MYOMY|nr:cytochrome P450 family 7 subfamily A member 1 [Myotis myotis]